jgi:hypothetical protein
MIQNLDWFDYICSAAACVIGLKLCGRQCPGEKATLEYVAIVAEEKIALCGGFHAFGDDA